MHCICCASSHNCLRNHAAGVFTQPEEMEMTCGPRKQRFFMSLPRVTRLFAATQSIWLPRFVPFTFLRRQHTVRKYSSLTDAVCVLPLVSSKNVSLPSLFRCPLFPSPTTKSQEDIHHFSPGLLKLSSHESPAPASPSVHPALPKIMYQFYHVTFLQGTPHCQPHNSVGSFHQLSGLTLSIIMWKTLKLQETASDVFIIYIRLNSKVSYNKVSHCYWLTVILFFKLEENEWFFTGVGIIALEGCQFLLYNEVDQLCVYIYTLPLGPLSNPPSTPPL